MTDTSAGHGQGAGRYEIRVKGHLGPRWAARFDGMTLTRDGDGTTVILTLPPYREEELP